jgi:hypothetical protein
VREAVERLSPEAHLRRQLGGPCLQYSDSQAASSGR